MGMHWGIGSEFYTGPVTEYLAPIVGLDFGFDFCFSRINLYIGGLLSLGGLSPDSHDCGKEPGHGDDQLQCGREKPVWRTSNNKRA